MKLLLDTHTFIWWDSDPSKLSTLVRDLCQDPANSLVLSVASVWEMQIKVQLGKLIFDSPLADMVSSQQRVNGVEVLTITLKHVLALSDLPQHHKDPFDRLLIAQAIAERAVLLSHDWKFREYNIDVRW